VFIMRRCPLDPESIDFYRHVRALQPCAPIVFYPGTPCGPCARKPLKPVSLECISHEAAPWEIEEVLARVARAAARGRAALLSAARYAEVRPAVRAASPRVA
jgi:hypothetical protein